MTSTNAIQDGLEALVLSYLKIMFHVDMIKFYSMLKYVEGHEEEIEDLFAAIGELDAPDRRGFLPAIPAPVHGSSFGGTGRERPHISGSKEALPPADPRSGAKQRPDGAGGFW